MPLLSPSRTILTKPVSAIRQLAERTRPGDGAAGWRTTLYNCYCHTFDEVTDQLMKAINCSETSARNLANIAHHTGQVKVCQGSRGHCETVADVLGAIGLRVSATG